MLIVSGILENITSRKDHTWKLVFGTNELTPEQVSEIARALDKFVFIGLKVDEFKSAETEIIENLETGVDDNAKTQSQRIKSILYLLWKQNSEGFDFDSYYRSKTEKFIEHLKSKIQ